MNYWTSLYERAKEEPYHLIPGILSLMNGYWHKLKFFLLGKNVKIGKCFRVYGKFRIFGPGRVEIGDYCLFDSSLFGITTFYTGFPQAKITIGHHVTTNAMVLQCYHSITIGDYCSLADSYLMDSQGHHLAADRRFLPTNDVPGAPIVLEKNVWVCSKVVVLHGVRIGENSVIAACSLVKKDVPANSFYSGNPARFVGPIPSTARNESTPLN